MFSSKLQPHQHITYSLCTSTYTSTCTKHSALPTPLPSTTFQWTQLTNIGHSRQNGTRCRDVVKVLWCHSHLVCLFLRVQSLHVLVFVQKTFCGCTILFYLFVCEGVCTAIVGGSLPTLYLWHTMWKLHAMLYVALLSYHTHTHTYTHTHIYTHTYTHTHIHTHQLVYANNNYKPSYWYNALAVMKPKLLCPYNNKHSALPNRIDPVTKSL